MAAWFQDLLGVIKPARDRTREGMILSGAGRALLAIDLLAFLNLGDPWIFMERRDDWKAKAAELEAKRSNLWNSFFTADFYPNWQGGARDALETHLRFNVNGLFAGLKKGSTGMSESMQGLNKEIVEYDFSVAALYLGSAAIFNELVSLSRTHPLGRGKLLAQALAVGGVFANTIKQFYDVVASAQGDLNKHQLNFNDLRASFFVDGDTSKPRNLSMSPQVDHEGNVRNPEFWRHSTGGVPAAPPKNVAPDPDEDWERVNGR
ncbi:hypothetical protein [Bailinhaonella thermotolerans]|uniref:Uncharacterized protein n=1 Tax=Bailinhaonella thermotolerans TaxID=1070861 RepID=A0A3A4AM61_9ACTN|nr:hypothetical protein [Bailinhaonella thermotolerans]RJL30031.1 hypothetical protein D5H75_24135 [Bailinhaonella thermotolerans]